MKKEGEKVSIVSCKDYNQANVDKAIKKSLNLIDFKFKKNSKVLIKPNIVGSFPKKQIACTTHPSIIEAICKILKENKCEIYIGDSPFTNPEISFQASGLNKLKKYGKLILFEQEPKITFQTNGERLKSFKSAKIIKEADLIINLPKLKTHTLAKFTGAIKNLYGYILGGMKQRLHLENQTDKDFSKILVDIYQARKPELNIMDGVIGMEGEGPTSGDIKQVGLILASKNSIALDIASSKLIGYNPKKIPAIKEAVKRKLYPNYKVDIVGEPLNIINFKKPSTMKGFFKKLFLKLRFKEKPIVCNHDLCIKCGLCMKHCPAKAITLNPYPTINKDKCIRCYCCMEICPKDALSLGKTKSNEKNNS